MKASRKRTSARRNLEDAEDEDALMKGAFWDSVVQKGKRWNKQRQLDRRVIEVHASLGDWKCARMLDAGQIYDPKRKLQFH